MPTDSTGPKGPSSTVGCLCQVPSDPAPDLGALSKADYLVRVPLDSIVHGLYPSTEAGKRPRLSEAQAAFQPPVLRLSGRACREHDQAHLSPTVWIDCSHERIRTAIVTAIRTRDNFRWAADHDIVVQVSMGLFADAESLSLASSRLGHSPLGIGLEFGDSREIHLHVENPGADDSACGLRIRATLTRDGVVVDRRVSRMGGLLKRDGAEQVYGCSTAHGILDMLHQSEAEDDLKAPPSDASINIGETDDIDAWIPLPPPATLDFLQAAMLVTGNTWEIPPLEQLRAIARPHDFALLDIGEELPSRIQNTYSGSGSGTQAILGHWKDNCLPTKEHGVTVLGGRGNVAMGRILPFDETIYVAGAKFTTRRVILSQSLGMYVKNPLAFMVFRSSGACDTAPGTSGSWVASGMFLCGSVMACYTKEPMAHMITAETLFQDIEQTLGLENAAVYLPEVRGGDEYPIEGEDLDINNPTDASTVFLEPQTNQGEVFNNTLYIAKNFLSKLNRLKESGEASSLSTSARMDSPTQSRLEAWTKSKVESQDEKINTEPRQIAQVQKLKIWEADKTTTNKGPASRALIVWLFAHSYP